MFETVVPESFETRSKRVFYESLPVSIALHALIVVGAGAATLWDVVFPTESPRISVAYSLTRIPEPPPPPPPPPKADAPKAEPVKALAPPLPLNQIVAPTVIPDRIPEVIPPPPEPPAPQPVVADAVPVATGGDPNGVIGGEIGGKIRGIKGGVFFPEDGRMHFDRDDKLPMDSVEQEYPRYPSEAQKKQLEGTVVVRYVIGTNGRVKDVEIIDPSVDKMFDEAAVEAIRRWRFRPLIKDGKRIEVVHELAVNFELVRR
jgi:protein TonB